MPRLRLYFLKIVFIPLLFLLLAPVTFGAKSKHLIEIEEESWRDLLKGEWMIEFHAPWCPACKDLQKTWNAFADWSRDLNINVAEVDVTLNPGLSGRFLVTALPTIYHIKDGVFRTYTGVRDKDDFITFIEEKKWTLIEPVPSWKHPNSPQMAVVAMFFKLSMSVRDLHNYLVEEKGLPTWLSYTIFGGVTLALGCILGFLIVCLIDVVFPANAPAKTLSAAAKKKEQKKREKEKKKKEKTSATNSNSQDEASQASDTAEESTDETVAQRKAEQSPKTKSPKASENDSKKKK